MPARNTLGLVQHARSGKVGDNGLTSVLGSAPEAPCVFGVPSSAGDGALATVGAAFGCAFASGA